MINQKRNLVLVILMIVLTLSQNSWASERCPMTKDQIDRKITFVTNYQKSLEPGRLAFARHYLDNLADLKMMEKGHMVSDVCEVIAAAASLYVGSYVMAGAIANSTITFMGTTYATNSLVGGGYMAYNGFKISKAAYDISKLSLHFVSDQTPREIFQNQISALRRDGLIPERVASFIIDPEWSGYSTELEHPAFAIAIEKLDQFRSAKLKEIGDSYSLWGVVGEFWHERGLKVSALETAVFDEARNIQEQRIIYLDIVKNLLLHQKNVCYPN